MKILSIRSFKHRFIILLEFCLLLIFIPNHVLAQNIDSKIHFALNNASLDKGLQLVEKLSGFHLSYAVQNVSKYDHIVIKNDVRTVRETLDLLLENTDLKYIVNKTHILIVLKNRPTVITPKNTSFRADNIIYGWVGDKERNALPGANVSIKGTKVGTITDVNGNFKISAKSSDILLVSFIGYITKEVCVGKTNEQFKIILNPNISQLDEVVVTAWGKEKKTTVVGSVSTIRPKELRGPSSNLTSMLSGRISGLISYQTSGEPGRDNAQFFIRGVGSFGTGRVNPLILINGIESTTNELARIQPDDIEGFSILKDATATSMYGSRGANGVILISTKSGKDGKMKFNIRYETSLSTNAKDYNLSDNITYMELANEASLTRGGERLYDYNKIEKTRSNVDPLLYPNNNWKDIMIKKYTQNHRANLNASGGGGIAKYYLSASFRYDDGILKTIKLNDFNTNVTSNSLEIRSNIDIKLTKTTTASMRINGLFDKLQGPSVGTGSDVFKSMLKANPVMFPAAYPQSFRSWEKHPLFGNAYISTNSQVENDLYYNPYASALSGYTKQKAANFTAQFELNQNFDFILNGLKGRLMAYTKRSTTNSFSRSVSPFYYSALADNTGNDEIKGLVPLNEETAHDYLNYSEGAKEVWNEDWLEGSLSYDQTFNKVHNVGGILLGYIREKELSNAGNLERSLPQRNVSLSGRLTYGYDNRYLAEFNFGYNASERFDSSHRWGFFPSIGCAWNLGNEAFLKNISYIDKLKIRCSYGLVGNDELTDWFNNGEERFFYLDMMNMNAGSIAFGTDYGKKYSTMAITRYANPNIGWEKSYKSNLALELGLFNSLNVEVEAFRDRRTHILMVRNDIPTTMGLLTTTDIGYDGNGYIVTGDYSPIRANIGQLRSQGFEATIDYNKNITKDLWATIRGTYTYAKNKTIEYEEPHYPKETSYRSRINHPWNTLWGLIAERLFIDQEDVDNSPKQFGSYMAGDIKYKDVNGDGIINDNDLVPMGYPTEPEINYGFGFSIGYKDFDFSSYFTGVANVSFMIIPSDITPFVRSGGKVNGLLDVIAKKHWSEDNRDPYAFFPRLSTQQISNNNRYSTWWLRNGSFFKLSSIELGYQPREKWVKQKMGLESLRIYLSGSNLFKISKFKMWDAEMKGDGMGYPLQRIFNLGIQLSL